MANADAPFGLQPVGGLDGSPYNGGTIECVLVAADATATFIGDAVVLSGTASDDGHAPAVAQAAPGNEIFGVITAFDADADDLTAQYRKASTERRCHVAPALDNLFMIQASGVAAITNVGATFDITVGAGDPISGYSTMELDVATSGSGNQLQILGLARDPANDIAEANANWIVRINESSLRGDGTAV